MFNKIHGCKIKDLRIKNSMLNNNKISVNFTGMEETTHHFYPFSSYSSSHLGNLKIQVKTHKGKKLYACSQCDYKCKRNYDLKRHMQVHTGERPFVCLYCDHKFALKYNLRTHIKLKHT